MTDEQRRATAHAIWETAAALWLLAAEAGSAVESAWWSEVAAIAKRIAERPGSAS